MRLLPIVEGDGDKAALPLLLRRMLAERHGIHDCKILKPHVRGELPSVRKNFENNFKAAIKESAAILWILDFDCDDCQCVMKEADALLVRAHEIYPDWPIEIAFMVQEYETLFLSDKTATRSVLKSIPADTDFPADPESVRGAKEWLSKAMPKGVTYKETVHQAKITATLNFDHLIGHSPSFAHLDRALARLVEKM
ncbi:MAG: DUF4276 family protein [Nitrosomonadales bacterium]|nr:DUF4276 family protein [Nitrosomonadales bacterium]